MLGSHNHCLHKQLNRWTKGMKEIKRCLMASILVGCRGFFLVLAMAIHTLAVATNLPPTPAAPESVAQATAQQLSTNPTPAGQTAASGAQVGTAASATEPYFPEYPKVNYEQYGAKSDAVKRGEYLVKMGDCIACHTDTTHHGPVFAGGLGFPTPFGTFYSPNITPDKETGIAGWTDAQFIRLMREGVRPDGSYSFPVFPYLWYTRVSDQDIKDIKAYLDALPPVHAVPPKNQVPFPFSLRFMQLGWRLMFFEMHKGEFKPDPNRSAQWNRGAYIVQGLGHCAMCHTPINALGGPKRKYDLTGNMINGFFAPNITSANLSHVAVDEILDVFLKNHLIGGGDVQGGMLEVNRDSLKYMTRDDLEAIAIYLQTVKSAEPPKKNTGDKGESAYQQTCFGCHDSGSGGAPKLGAPDDWKTRVAQGKSILYQHAILGYQGMPAKGSCFTCSDADIEAAVDYMLKQNEGGSGAAATSATLPPPPPPLTLLQGEGLYTAHCASCHNPGAASANAPKLGALTDWQPLLGHGFDELLLSVLDPHKHQPARGGCPTCNDAELKAATKYLLQKSSPADKNYNLW